MVEPLKSSPRLTRRPGPVVLVVMDGVGYGRYPEGDAVAGAALRALPALEASCPHTRLKAHGTAVGLPSDDDMGNSEVGHNAIGCGRVFAQGAKLVAAAIASGALFEGKTWRRLVANVSMGGAMHFIGLLSDGNVHSHIDHLKAMILRAREDGVRTVRIHALLDGRDVGETSALDYVDPFEEFLADLRSETFDARIASGGGRMVITMDRYNADWGMVERGWRTHVQGEGRRFSSAREAIETLRAERPGVIDQDLGAFVVAREGVPVGPIEDGDSVIFFNFRGDRALEITAAFEGGPEFDRFDRGRVPAVEFAGMMQYDGDLRVPRQYLVEPPAISRTQGEYLAATGLPVLAVSETQKFGHVTYFYNGNRTGKFSEETEDYVEIPSDRVPFEQRPWMKCAEITDHVLGAIAAGKYRFIRLNYPNGDMVGHTGVYQAVLCAMEAMDLQIERLRRAVEAAGGVLILTADHGNADDMFERDKRGAVARKEDGTPKAKTAHSLNAVPCIVYDPRYAGEYEPTLRAGLGISSLAATVIELLGYEAPEGYDPSVLVWRPPA